MSETNQPSESELLWRASGGDRSALLKLTDFCVCAHLGGIPQIEAFTMAEGFARLAAADGNSNAAMMLAGVLRVRAYQVADLGDIDRASSLMFESEYLCDQYPRLLLSHGAEFLGGVLTGQADMGDETATVRLNKLFEALGPSDADRLRQAINKACADKRETPKPEAVGVSERL